MEGRLARVMLAFGVFSVVEYAVWVTVLLYAYEEGGPGLAGLVAVAQLLPAAALAPLLGAVGDRVPRGAALAASYAVEVALIAVLGALLVAGASIGIIAAVAALVTTCVSVGRPVHYAALPQVAATPRALVNANSLSGVLDGVGLFAGPVLAGLVTAASGPATAMWACAAAMAVAAVLVLGLGLPSATGEGGGEGSELRGALAGIRHARGDGPLLVLLVLVGVAYLTTGAIELLAVAFADSVIGAGDAGAGLLIGASGVGALVGAAAAAGLALRPRLTPGVLIGLLVTALALMAMAAAGALVPALAVLAIGGAGEAFGLVAARTLLQRSTDDRILARVFALQEGVLLLGLALGAVAAPALIAWAGPATAFVPLGISVAVLALLAWPWIRALDARAAFRPEVIALLRRLDFLSAMPPPALERLSHAARWVDVEAGEVVIRQGDTGDRFYAVGSGTLGVQVDGQTRAHVLGPGDGCGEIALLHDIPRTATITALEPCRLLAIDREDFLAAVTGSPDGRRVAEQVAAAHLERDRGTPHMGGASSEK